ncbi:MAG: TonB-dependent receptor [Candidatus Schekmanbacteria bacterium]|nr:TonB-dependent receptor [Candidatus Schekmanbacteria bacterium]
MRRKNLLLVVMITLFLGLWAENIWAQLGGEYAYFLEEEVVTPTKTARSINKVPAIVTVINWRQIENMGAQTIRDILENIPGLGISINRYGKYMIEARGVKTVNSDKVLIMVDGHKLNIPGSGGAQHVWDDMIVDNIEKVEIVKGPGSALYGSGAFLTIVNIITRKADDINGTITELRGGSYDTWGGDVLFGNYLGDLGITFNADYLNTDGFKAWIEEDYATLLGQPSAAPGKTDMRLQKADLSLNLEYKDIYWRSRYLEKERGTYIGVSYALGDSNDFEVRHWYSVLGIKKSVSADLDIKAELSIDQVDMDLFWELFQPGFLGRFPNGVLGEPKLKNQTLALDLQADYELFTQNLLTVGWNVERIKQYDVIHYANFDPNTLVPLFGLTPLSSFQEAPNWNRNVKRHVWALYFQDYWNITKDISLTVGGRFDQYNDFGNAFSPRGGITWQATDALGFKLLYGKAFRAPNFEQLYNANNPSQLGNENLRAEKADTYEAEINYQFSPLLVWRANYFYNRIEDLIGTSLNANGQLQFENNTGVSKIDGVETELRAQVEEGHYGYINYTFINPQDETGRRISEVAVHRGNIGFNYLFNEYLNSNTRLMLVGKRYRAFGDSRESMNPYAMLNESITLKNLLKDFELQATVFNLLDTEYEDPTAAGTVRYDFPKPGINFILEARYNF